MIFLVGAGGGSISNDRALLHMKAPTGSTITLRKSNIQVATILPIKAIVDSSDATFSHYYYSVDSNNYGSWTITATVNNDTTTETITVDSVKEYDIELSLKYYLFKAGTGMRMGFSTTKPSNMPQPTIDTSSIRWTNSSSTGGIAIVLTPSTSMANFKRLIFDMTYTPYAALYKDFSFGISDDNVAASTKSGMHFTAVTDISGTVNTTTPRNEFSVNIESYNSESFIKFVCAYSAGYIYNIYLSKA